MAFRSLLLYAAFLLSACNSSGKQPGVVTDTLPKAGISKPGSPYPDTFNVNEKAAVFYSPDTAQLKRIHNSMDNGVFEATMHEYDNQFRVSQIELKENWKSVKVFEISHYRFVRFAGLNGKITLIDLDQKGEPCGLIAFDPSKAPQVIDMMNVGTQLYYYFSAVK